MMLYDVVWLWLEVVGPFFSSERLIRDWIAVFAVDVLLVSSPSGIVLSGSTSALFRNSGISWFGACTLISIVRTDGTPGIVSVGVPSIVAPVQLTRLPPNTPHVKAPGGGGFGAFVESLAERNVAPAGSSSRTVTFDAG